MSTAHTRRQLAGLAAAVCCIAALPGAAVAASSSAAARYNVTVKRGVLAHGRTVKAKAAVSNPERAVASWWSRSTVSAVVRKGVDGGIERPYSSRGYRCTPAVRGSAVKYTCKLRGADVPTAVKLTFSVTFRSGDDVASPAPTAQYEFPIQVDVTGEPANQTVLITWRRAARCSTRTRPPSRPLRSTSRARRARSCFRTTAS
jgi:hypothetical protein